MMRDDLALLTELQRIAEQAGNIIMTYFSQQVAFDAKGDGSPVTLADKAADAFITQALHRMTPTIPVVSEEMVHPVSTVTRRAWSCLWLVDPLDGTRQFIRGDQGFSVNIALIEAHAPVIGVVYSPVEQIGYAAVRGKGAWRWDAQGQKCPIHVAPVAQPIRVLTGFSSSPRGEKTRCFLNALPAYQLFELGSSLKICRVAEGAADVYPRFGLTSEWDTAAAQVVLTEAGGVLMGVDGLPLTYNARDTLENPPFVAVGQVSYPWPMQPCAHRET
ncbi:MAG: 3'(2'),5'-bisphosphate nucleotidase CysQ [Proteobacteria bacterium]|nr:3'(2'),5'-bisphosphate nucleotidase CysQ [Pseudomonadota bacterium]